MVLLPVWSPHCSPLLLGCGNAAWAGEVRDTRLHLPYAILGCWARGKPMSHSGSGGNAAQVRNDIGWSQSWGSLIPGCLVAAGNHVELGNKGAHGPSRRSPEPEVPKLLEVTGNWEPEASSSAAEGFLHAPSHSGSWWERQFLFLKCLLTVQHRKCLLITSTGWTRC